LVETPKETGNKLLNKINRKICQIKIQRIFYIGKKNREIKMQRKKWRFTILASADVLSMPNKAAH